MDLDDFRWLLTPAGQWLLGTAEEAADTSPLALSERLRRTAAPGQVAAALTQADLRRRARVKFGEDAGRMYFTPDALEQATRRSVAAHRAARLARAGVRHLTDLGCGIGGDLVAFARAGITSLGVDLDPLRAAVAEANLASLGLPGSVECLDAETVDTSGDDAVFVDPARRTARGRAFRVEDHSPPWEFVLRQLQGDACVKTAPGIAHALVPAGVEAEWVSHRGEVKEAALWSGGLASGARRASVLDQGGVAELVDADLVDAPTRDPGPFLIEPDGAVIRAGLVSALPGLSGVVGGGLLDEHIAWITADSPVTTPFGRCYAVREQLPFRVKPLRTVLRERGIGPITVKTRGVDVAPERLRQQLGLRGDVPATVVLTRARGKGVAFLVEPCP